MVPRELSLGALGWGSGMTAQPGLTGPDESPGMEVEVVSIEGAGSCCDCPMIFAALNTAAEHALKRGRPRRHGRRDPRCLHPRRCVMTATIGAPLPDELAHAGVRHVAHERTADVFCRDCGRTFRTLFDAAVHAARDGHVVDIDEYASSTYVPDERRAEA